MDNYFKGEKKKPNNKIDFVFLIYRNTEHTKWGITGGGRWVNVPVRLNGYKTENAFLLGEALKSPYPITILTHEFSHGFLGGNAYHTMGGAHSWNLKYGNTVNFGLNNGWGLIGAGDIFKSCNGWDRQRLGWEKPGQQFYDLNAGIVPPDGLIVELRDFVKYGDALKVQLPHIPEDEPQQYIWFENHSMENYFDQPFPYLEDTICYKPLIEPGIYAFHQTGMDNTSELKVTYQDFLKPISAEGKWDFRFTSDTVRICSAGGAYENILYKWKMNPLSGYDDFVKRFYDVGTLENSFEGNGRIMANKYPLQTPTHKNNTCFNHSDETQLKTCWTKDKPGNGGNIDAVPPWVELKNGKVEIWKAMGPEERFTIGDEIGIDENPSTASINYRYVHKYGNKSYEPESRSLNSIYINGLSVRILDTSKGTYKLHVSYHDFDLKNDVRWCGERIIVKDSLIVYSQLELDQSLTPNSCFPFENGLFAPPTIMVIEEGAVLMIENGADVRLKNNSTLEFKNGSSLIIEKGGKLQAKRGKLLIEDGVKLINKGRIKGKMN